MNHNSERTFKDIVKLERMRRGWSQANLAEKIGVSERTVHRWENGESLPQSFPRQRLCELFEKTPETLGLLREAREVTDNEILHDASQQSNLALGDTSTAIQKDIENVALVPISSPLSPDISQLPDSHSSVSSVVINGPRFTRRTILASAAGLALVGVGGFSWWKFFPHSPGNLLYVYRGHSDSVTSVTWSPNGDRIASGSYDRTVQVWDAANGGHIYIYHGHNKRVTCVAWSPDGTRIASGSDDSTVQVWNAVNGSHIYTYRGHSDDVHRVTWSPDSTRIASGSNDHTVQVWNAHDGSQVLIHRDPIYVWALAWSPNGKRIASGSSDSLVLVWDAQNGNILVTYDGHRSGVSSVTWSPDSTRVASGSDDNSVLVFNAQDGNTLVTYQAPDKIWAVAWSPDGTRIASGCVNGTVPVCNAQNGSILLVYKGHSGDVGTVAWSPDSTRIASGSADRTVQVWDAPSPLIHNSYSRLHTLDLI